MKLLKKQQKNTFYDQNKKKCEHLLKKGETSTVYYVFSLYDMSC